MWKVWFILYGPLKRKMFSALYRSQIPSLLFSQLSLFFLPFCFIKTLKNDKQNSGKAKWKPSCALSLFILSFLFFCSTFHFLFLFDSLYQFDLRWRKMKNVWCRRVFISLSPPFSSLLFELVLCFSLSFDQKCKLIQTDSKPRRVQKSFPLSNFLYFLSLSLSMSLLLVTWEVLRWWREGDQSAKVFFFSLFTCFLFSPSTFYLPGLIRRVLWGW